MVNTTDLLSAHCSGNDVDLFQSSPSASQQFEGRGADELNNLLTLALERLFSGPQSGLDLAKLCIIPGQQCWVIYIDAMVRYSRKKMSC